MSSSFSATSLGSKTHAEWGHLELLCWLHSPLANTSDIVPITSLRTHSVTHRPIDLMYCCFQWCRIQLQLFQGEGGGRGVAWIHAGPTCSLSGHSPTVSPSAEVLLHLCLPDTPSAEQFSLQDAPVFGRSFSVLCSLVCADQLFGLSFIRKFAGSLMKTTPQQQELVGLALWHVKRHEGIVAEPFCWSPGVW